MTGSLVLVGGGLANCLLALRLRAVRPELPLTLLEAGPCLGGNHTWSFHGTDVPATVGAWLGPLANHSWTHYDVRFPQRERRLEGRYYSLTSAHLHRVVMGALGESVRLHTRVGEVTPHRVTLEGGEVLTGALVLDGRGLISAPPGLTLGFQKFLGQHLRLIRPHGLTGPLLMDATVSQEQGYRFVYLLPLGARELLIEDTYYGNTGALNPEALRQNIGRYAAERLSPVETLLREERGVLPVVLDCHLETFWPAVDRVPRVGLRAGLFHHTTGYSLPEAAALAEDLSATVHLNSHSVMPWIRIRVVRRWREQRLFRYLNRMLFLGAAPAERYRILQHFYRLPAGVIERFFAGRLTLTDGLHLLTGTPPIPVLRALRCVLPASSRRPALIES